MMRMKVRQRMIRMVRIWRHQTSINFRLQLEYQPPYGVVGATASTCLP